jgi:predicted nucleic acid-binding protein
MVRAICLDSDVVIDILRNGSARDLLGDMDAEFYLTSINIFEIWYGKKNSENLPAFFNLLKISDFDKNAAILAADILLKLRKEGEDLDYRDLFTASVCIIHDLELLTHNKKHFERLKKFGLKLV